MPNMRSLGQMWWEIKGNANKQALLSVWLEDQREKKSDFLSLILKMEQRAT